MVGFDHHCGVLGVCIGRDNQPWFIALLLSGAVSLLTVGVSTLNAALHDARNSALALQRHRQPSQRQR